MSEKLFFWSLSPSDGACGREKTLRHRCHGEGIRPLCLCASVFLCFCASVPLCFKGLDNNMFFGDSNEAEQNLIFCSLSPEQIRDSFKAF